LNSMGQPQHKAEPRRGDQPPIGELCVIGHPSRLGGADTELDHQIHCWQAMGAIVHVCHTGPLDDNLRSMNLEQRGCVYHEPRDWASVKGLHCISFCNGEYLKNLPEIKRYARSTSWVNCMTWSFDLEIEMHAKGLIDFHLYQIPHGYARVGGSLRDLANYRPLLFEPYFHADEFPFRESRPRDKFRFGRISRSDPDKFGRRQLWIYETMTAPVLKEGLILGWDHRIEANARHRCQEPFLPFLGRPCGRRVLSSRSRRTIRSRHDSSP